MTLDLVHVHLKLAACLQFCPVIKWEQADNPQNFSSHPSFPSLTCRPLSWLEKTWEGPRGSCERRVFSMWSWDGWGSEKQQRPDAWIMMMNPLTSNVFICEVQIKSDYEIDPYGINVKQCSFVVKFCNSYSTSIKRLSANLWGFTPSFSSFQI